MTMDIIVSVVTPTYNRRAIIPILIQIYKNQTYPKENMEWIILDDGRDKVEDLFQEAAKTIPNLRYLPLNDKMRIGAKRNVLNREAKGSIIIAMDDDDYYPADRIKTVVEAFTKYPRVDLAGSSEMFLQYKHQMIQLDPKKTILVICHTDNTVDKAALREEHLSSKYKAKEKMRETSYCLEDFVKESSLRLFYCA